MGRIADAWGDSRQKRGNSAEKHGGLPEKLDRTRSRSSLRGGIHWKPRVIRGARLLDAPAHRNYFLLALRAPSTQV